MIGKLAVDILFKTEQLEALCSQERVANRRLGKKGARKLRTRLADLMAAKNMISIVFGRPHPLTGGLSGCIGFDLDGGCRLAVEAANEPVPVKDDGGIDWSKVDVVRVVYIGDYHG